MALCFILVGEGKQWRECLPVLKWHFLPPSAVLPPGGTVGPHPSASGLYRPLSPLALCLAASSGSYGEAASRANYRMEEVSGGQPPETLLLTSLPAL